MTTVPDVSVIVIAWNVRDELEACFESIRDHAGPLTTETIYIDNGSTDGSADLVAQRFAEITIVRLPTNEGVPARNHGLRRAKGRYGCSSTATPASPPERRYPPSPCSRRTPASGSSVPASSTPTAGCNSAPAATRTAERGVVHVELLRQRHRSAGTEAVGPVEVAEVVHVVDLSHEVAVPRHAPGAVPPRPGECHRREAVVEEP